MRKAKSYIPNMQGSQPLVRADELARIQPRNKRVELVRGRLVVREPAGLRHGIVAMRIAARMDAFVQARQLGVVVAAETGFKLLSDPDTVRAPDAAFIRAERVPTPLPRGYAGLAPDLVAEVLSPDDRPGDVLAKVADWLDGGSRIVWVLDPERLVTRVYRADGTESILGATDELDGEDVLPGFKCQLSDVFAVSASGQSTDQKTNS